MKPAVLKAVSIFTALCLFTTQAGMASTPQENIWLARRVNTQKKTAEKSSPLLASLAMPVVKPVSALINPVTAGSSRFKNSTISENLRNVLSAVPSHLATLREIHDSQDPGQPAIVLVEDVHMNEEAQNNIAGVLQKLIDEKKVGFIGVEGAFGPFNFEPIRGIGDRAIVADLAKALLKEKLVSAPAFIGMSSPVQPPLMMGVDDRARYDANKRAYVETREIKDSILKELKQTEAFISAQKASALSPPLREFDQLRLRYRRSEIGLGAYLEKSKAMDPENDPVIGRFEEAYALEKSLDMKRVEREREEVIRFLTRCLDKNEMASLLTRSLAYRTGQLSFGDFYRGLRDLCQSKGVRLNQSPAFNSYLNYVLLADAINVSDMFNRLEKREERIIARLQKTDREKRMMALSEQIILAQRLTDFSLTPQDWNAYRRNKAKLDFSGDLKALNKLEKFESFYTQADARSRSMAEALIERKAPGNAVMVTGGFHSREMAVIFRQRNVSFAIVSPKIEKIEAETGVSYLSAFTEAKAPLEQLFTGQKLFLALARQSIFAGDTPEADSGAAAVLGAAAAKLAQAGKTANPDSGVEATETNASGVFRLSVRWNKVLRRAYATVGSIPAGFKALGSIAGVKFLEFNGGMRKAGLWIQEQADLILDNVNETRLKLLSGTMPLSVGGLLALLATGEVLPKEIAIGSFLVLVTMAILAFIAWLRSSTKPAKHQHPVWLQKAVDRDNTPRRIETLESIGFENVPLELRAPFDKLLESINNPANQGEMRFTAHLADAFKEALNAHPQKREALEMFLVDALFKIIFSEIHDVNLHSSLFGDLENVINFSEVSQKFVRRVAFEEDDERNLEGTVVDPDAVSELKLNSPKIFRLLSNDRNKNELLNLIIKLQYLHNSQQRQGPFHFNLPGGAVLVLTPYTDESIQKTTISLLENENSNQAVHLDILEDAKIPPDLKERYQEAKELTKTTSNIGVTVFAGVLNASTEISGTKLGRQILISLRPRDHQIANISSLKTVVLAGNPTLMQTCERFLAVATLIMKFAVLLHQMRLHYPNSMSVKEMSMSQSRGSLVLYIDPAALLSKRYTTEVQRTEDVARIVSRLKSLEGYLTPYHRQNLNPETYPFLGTDTLTVLYERVYYDYLGDTPPDKKGGNNAQPVPAKSDFGIQVVGWLVNWALSPFFPGFLRWRFIIWMAEAAGRDAVANMLQWKEGDLLTVRSMNKLLLMEALRGERPDYPSTISLHLHEKYYSYRDSHSRIGASSEPSLFGFAPDVIKRHKEGAKDGDPVETMTAREREQLAGSRHLYFKNNTLSIPFRTAPGHNRKIFIEVPLTLVFEEGQNANTPKEIRFGHLPADHSSLPNGSRVRHSNALWFKGGIALSALVSLAEKGAYKITDTKLTQVLEKIAREREDIGDDDVRKIVDASMKRIDALLQGFKSNGRSDTDIVVGDRIVHLSVDKEEKIAVFVHVANSRRHGVINLNRHQAADPLPAGLSALVESKIATVNEDEFEGPMGAHTVFTIPLTHPRWSELSFAIAVGVESDPETPGYIPYARFHHTSDSIMRSGYDAELKSRLLVPDLTLFSQNSALVLREMMRTRMAGNFFTNDDTTLRPGKDRNGVGQQYDYGGYLIDNFNYGGKENAQVPLARLENTIRADVHFFLQVAVAKAKDSAEFEEALRTWLVTVTQGTLELSDTRINDLIRSVQLQIWTNGESTWREWVWAKVELELINFITPLLLPAARTPPRADMLINPDTRYRRTLATAESLSWTLLLSGVTAILVLKLNLSFSSLVGILGAVAAAYAVANAAWLLMHLLWDRFSPKAERPERNWPLMFWNSIWIGALAIAAGAGTVRLQLIVLNLTGAPLQSPVLAMVIAITAVAVGLTHTAAHLQSNKWELRRQGARWLAELFTAFQEKNVNGLLRDRVLNIDARAGTKASIEDAFRASLSEWLNDPVFLKLWTAEVRELAPQGEMNQDEADLFLALLLAAQPSTLVQTEEGTAARSHLLVFDRKELDGIAGEKNERSRRITIMAILLRAGLSTPTDVASDAGLQSEIDSVIGVIRSYGFSTENLRTTLLDPSITTFPELESKFGPRSLSIVPRRLKPAQRRGNVVTLAEFIPEIERFLLSRFSRAIMRAFQTAA